MEDSPVSDLRLSLEYPPVFLFPPRLRPLGTLPDAGVEVDANQESESRLRFGRVVVGTRLPPLEAPSVDSAVAGRDPKVLSDPPGVGGGVGRDPES